MHTYKEDPLIFVEFFFTTSKYSFQSYIPLFPLYFKNKSHILLPGFLCYKNLSVCYLE